eukprot:2885895-Heterocapsa_arctica.AAC.2
MAYDKIYMPLLSPADQVVPLCDGEEPVSWQAPRAGDGVRDGVVGGGLPHSAGAALEPLARSIVFPERVELCCLLGRRPGDGVRVP